MENIPLDKTLTGLFLIGSGHLLLKIGELLWGLLKKKVTTSEDTLLANTSAVKSLTDSIVKLENTVSTIPKMQKDLKRSFFLHKKILGDRWKEYAKEFEEDENLNG